MGVPGPVEFAAGRAVSPPIMPGWDGVPIPAAFAADMPEFQLAIENHKFIPDRIEVPAGRKVKLVVDNRDATAEEFESGALRIEKVIAGKGKGIVYVGPLEPGEHKFTFDGSNLPSGIYLARVQAGDFVKTQKLLLLK